jgi:phospholipid/cholesterol/gamma-HCH transport system substrate-binding protein
MSSEIKIGILALVTIAVSLWGYKFIMGRNLLKPSNQYYVEYQNIDLLKKATDVTVNGFPVGVVADIYMKPNDPDKKIVVVLDLNKGIQIPKDTRAVIASTSFMGDKSITLKYDKPCSGPDCASSGDYLQGEVQGFMSYMMGGDGSIDSYMASIKSAFSDMLDTLNQQMLSENSGTVLSASLKDLRQTLANLESGTAQLDAIMRQSGGNINNTMDNVDAITGNLKKQEAVINTLLGNVSTMSTQLREADLKKTLEEVKATVSRLQSTLATTEEAIDHVNGIMTKVNAGEGTLGKLLTNDELFLDLTSMSNRADSLLNDFQARPYRYMPLKSRNRVIRFDKLDAAQSNQ